MKVSSIKHINNSEEVFSLTVKDNHNYYIGDKYNAILSKNSQAEVRVMARASGDESLLEAFYHDADIHRFVASRVVNKPEKDVTEAERRFSKMAVFSILYGKSEAGMANDFMNGDLTRAKKLYNDFFSAFPKIKDYVRSKHKEALDTGMVSTIFGDTIPVDMPDYVTLLDDENKEKLINNVYDKSVPVNQEDRKLIATALRHAQNYAIQSASSSIAALCIKSLSDKFLEKDLHAYIDCFTHDSADIDTPITSMYDVLRLIPEISVKEPRAKYGVPMKIDIELTTGGNSNVSFEDPEFDDEDKSVVFKFSGEKSSVDKLFDRLKRNNVKVEYEITEEYSRLQTVRDLFITRRAYNINFGRLICKVEGKVKMVFSSNK